MRHTLDDLRFILRQLRRAPAFTAAATLTLALAAGATTAILSVVDGVLIRPLPFPDSGRLVTVCETHESVAQFCVASPPTVADFAAQSRTIEAIGIARSWPMALGTGSGRQGISGGLATPGFWRALGASAAIGRLFLEDDQPGPGRAVAVLSHELWAGTFGADSGIVGRAVVLDGVPYEVIGVLPAGLAVPELEGVRAWVPLPFDPRDEERRRWRGFQVVARRAQGASVEAVRLELAAIQGRLGERYPATNAGWGVRVTPALEALTGSVRGTLVVFLAAAALLLLVACANVAGLLVARGTARFREFSVRAAIGARPAHLFRLVALESLVLGAAGGALGLLGAGWATQLFLALMPPGLPRAASIAVDARVMGIALAVVLLATTVAGFGPAMRAMRVDLAEAMKQGQQPRAWRRALGVRGGFVTAEVAIACVLTVGAGLLVRSYARYLRWEPGFDRAGLLTFWTSAAPDKYPDAERVSALFTRLAEELRKLPGVTAVGAASSGPLFGGIETDAFIVPASGDTVSARWYDVGAGFFSALRLPMLRGREFSASDGRWAPAAIVNETMARRAWPGQDPLGRRLRLAHGEEMQVVGVVADVPPFRPGRPAEPEVYWPYAQAPRWASFFVLRSSGDPAALVRAVRDRLRSVDGDLDASSVMTMDERVNAQLRRPRFNTLLIGLFAIVALVLALIGVYGVVAAGVAGRSRELGVRLALGASGAEVVRMVLRQGMGLAFAGLAVGLGLAFVLARFVASLVPGVRPSDPLTFGSVAVLLAGAAFAACWLPARHASAVDPVAALRME